MTQMRFGCSEPVQLLAFQAKDDDTRLLYFEISDLYLIAESPFTHLFSHNGETDVVISYTCRQDGNTDWMVAVTEVDGRVTLTQSRCPTGQLSSSINSALERITKGLRWLEPLGVRNPHASAVSRHPASAPYAAFIN